MLGLAVAAVASAATGSFTFFSIGDWGGADLEKAVYGQNVRSVAQAMASTAAQDQAPNFVIGTGDNFYYCGIQNETDPQVQKDWSTPYSSIQPSMLDVPWYNSLGNHEYGYNVDAQIQLSSKLNNWILPARYYTKRVPTDSGFITMIFLDTSPCVQAYRSENSNGWDPCGSQYPTCSISSTNDDFEGKCEFHDNIIAQDCETQFNWFTQQLSSVPADDWLIVVGHHPADEMDVYDFVTPMVNRGFALYVNGHAHTLTQYAINTQSNYITTGAGAMVISFEKNPRDPFTHPAANRTYRKEEGLPLDRNVHEQGYTVVWNSRVSGFTAHTLSDDNTQLSTNYYDTHGQIIHTFVVDKKGNVIGPSPGPPPVPPNPSPPPPSGTCCFYGDKTCTAGQTCCKSECHDASSCSYSQSSCNDHYGQAHHCTWTGTNCIVGNAANTTAQV
mmetsp:Transcript_4145/g.10484  ORF Transcript_4145/g.10484 Transcript_4145/m.10484 type:complete len:443 (+) Transcript_4145:18-1346(+)